MLRHSVCAALALVLAAGSLPAQPSKPVAPRMTIGKIKEIDPKKGVLTLTVKKGDEEKETKIDIDEDTKFVVLGKGGAKELTAKEAAKAETFKAGTTVHIMKGPEGQIRIMTGVPLDFPHPNFPGPGNFVVGKIKEVDADKGTLTVTIKEKGGKTKDKEFKVGKDTQVMVMTGKGPPKPTRGKDGLKAKQFKGGAMVSLQADKDGTV